LYLLDKRLIALIF